MRSAHSCIFSALLLATAGTGASAFAQNPTSALDAHAPTLPLQHQALQPSGSIVQQPGDWRKANQAVAEFPRGHADIVRWETEQKGADNTPAAARPMPMGKPMQHGHGEHHHGAKP